MTSSNRKKWTDRTLRLYHFQRRFGTPFVLVPLSEPHLPALVPRAVEIIFPVLCSEYLANLANALPLLRA